MGFLTVALAATVLAVGCSTATPTEPTPEPQPTTTATTTPPRQTHDCPTRFDGGTTFLEIGTQAPNLILPDENGECAFSLADHIGERKVVLMFHRGLWCSICQGQLSQFNNSRQRIENENAIIVGISPERILGSNSGFSSSFTQMASRYAYSSLTTGHIENDDDIYAAFTGHANGNPRAAIVIDTDGKIAARFVSIQYYGDDNIDPGRVVQALQAAS